MKRSLHQSLRAWRDVFEASRALTFRHRLKTSYMPNVRRMVIMERELKRQQRRPLKRLRMYQ